MKSYDQLALRTAAEFSSAVVNVNHETLSAFKGIANALRSVAAGSDALKRVLFYGDHKPLVNGGPLPSVAMFRATSSWQVIDLIHAALGIVSEAGELFEAVSEHVLNGATLDEVNIAEELGDNQWYTALACRAVGTTIDDVQAQNIAKLRARYPKKFESEQALVRDLETERAVLEKSHAPKEPEHISDLQRALEQTINCHSAENGSDTPDFILAEFLQTCLRAYDEAVSRREKWYGRETSPVAVPATLPEAEIDAR